MRLNDPLITSFYFDDKEYQIDLAYDNVLDVFDVLEDKKLRDLEKIETALLLLLDNEFSGEHAIELWNHIYTNYIAFEEKQVIEYDLNGDPMPVQEDEDEVEEKTMDLDQDAEYIYASFRQAYNINLYHEQGKMHWHEFKSLLSGLPDDTIMQRIRQIRSWEPSKGDPEEYKESMRKMQKIYALDKEVGDSGE